MSKTREELWEKLVEKTKALGHKVNFSEVNSDPEMPKPNDYAYYWGSFSLATEEAYRSVFYGTPKERQRVDKGVKDISKKVTTLDPERMKKVLDECVEMFIESGGLMPSARAIKKNNRITEEEVEILRKSGDYSEHRIRKMAEAKTGIKYPTPGERRRKASAKVRNEQREKAIVENAPKEVEADMENNNDVLKDEKVRRWTSEECERVFRAACEEAGYILNWTQVSKREELPAWNILQKYLGKWYTWGKKFGLPYSSDRTGKMAKRLLEQREAHANENLKKTEKALVEEEVQEVQEVQEAQEVVQAEIQEVVSVEAEPRGVVDEFGKALSMENALSRQFKPPVEVKKEIKESEPGVGEISIRFVVPKGAKGSIQFSLEF